MKPTTAAWFAMIRYVLYAVLLDFSGWLSKLGPDKWQNLTSYEIVTAATQMALAGLVAIGAVMNGRWHEARLASSNDNDRKPGPSAVQIATAVGLVILVGGMLGCSSNKWQVNPITQELHYDSSIGKAHEGNW